MYCVCNQFLACPRLARDQDVGVRFGDAVDRLEDVLHRLAAADDVEVRGTARQPVTQMTDFGGLRPALDCLRNQHQQFFEFDGLLDEKESSGLGRFDCFGHRAIPGDHDDLQVGRRSLELPNELDSVDVGQIQVGEHQVERVAADLLDPLASGRRRLDEVTRVDKVEPRELEHGRVIVNDQYIRLLHRFALLARYRPVMVIRRPGLPVGASASR